MLSRIQHCRNNYATISPNHSIKLNPNPISNPNTSPSARPQPNPNPNPNQIRLANNSSVVLF
jgi:hypothetical protein